MLHWLINVPEKSLNVTSLNIQKWKLVNQIKTSKLKLRIRKKKEKFESSSDVAGNADSGDIDIL